jgi:hypothetical protein
MYSDIPPNPLIARAVGVCILNYGITHGVPAFDIHSNEHVNFCVHLAAP